MRLGRPPIYDSVEALEKEIQMYFDNPPTKPVPVKDGFIQMPCITVSGLAYHLGFESRQSMYDYEKREAFSYTIKRARLFIEQEYEMQLQTGNITGAIFALKNFGWKDKSETELSGGLEINRKPKEWLNENEQQI